MRESTNAAKLIANLCQCETGEHMLFRGYGVATVDNNRMPTRSQVSTQAARWYPEVRVTNIQTTGVNEQGHVQISVSLG